MVTMEKNEKTLGEIKRWIGSKNSKNSRERLYNLYHRSCSSKVVLASSPYPSKYFLFQKKLTPLAVILTKSLNLIGNPSKMPIKDFRRLCFFLNGK